MSWVSFVKRKATKAVPVDFPEIKLTFLKLIVDCVKEYNISPELIINWDQTGAEVPTSEWALAEEGSKQVTVIGKEDKREMTVPLSCTMSGFLLPPNLIYCGKTNAIPTLLSPLDGMFIIQKIIRAQKLLCCTSLSVLLLPMCNPPEKNWA